MSNTFDKKGMATLIGAAVVTSLSASTASAQDNPFAMKDLSTGFVQVAEQKEMTCGEGKCGSSMMKEGQGKKDMTGMKGMEGKCAGNMQGNEPPKSGDSKSAAPAPAPAGSMKP